MTVRIAGVSDAEPGRFRDDPLDSTTDRFDFGGANERPEAAERGDGLGSG